MKRVLHVVNRDGVFYWRRRLPADVAGAFGRPQILISTRSRDPRAAHRIARRLSVQFDRFLYAMQIERRIPTAEEQKLILKQLYRTVIEGCREERARWYHGDELPPEAFAGDAAPTNHEDPAVIEDIERQSFFQDPKDTAETLRSDLATNRYKPIRWLLKPLLARHHIDADTDQNEFRMFLRLATQLAIHAFADAEGEIGGDVPPPGLDALVAEARAAVDIMGRPKSPAEPLRETQQGGSASGQIRVEPSAAASPSAPPISAFIPVFLKEGKVHVTSGTSGQKEASLKLLVKVVGDIPADKVKREDAKKLHSILEKLPSTYGKSARHASMSIDEVIASKRPGEKTMSVATLNRHWRTVVAFFRYVNVQDNASPMNLERIFGEFRWSPTVPKKQDRIRWDDESLTKLFSSPIWTGFEPDPRRRHWRHEVGPIVVKDEYWWLPILGLYHGARQEELSQLKGIDIFRDEESGITVMNFHAGMKLKTESSIRKVPVHSAVIELGFLELAQRAGSGLLFPKMRPGGRDNKHAYEYTQHFTAYRKDIGVYRKLMDFHSFRYNLTTKMIDEGNRTILEVDEITGHDSENRDEIQGMSKSETLRYFGGHRLARLKEALETVNYPGIDLVKLADLAKGSTENEANLAKKYPKAWGELSSLSPRRKRPIKRPSAAG